MSYKDSLGRIIGPRYSGPVGVTGPTGVTEPVGASGASCVSSYDPDKNRNKFYVTFRNGDKEEGFYISQDELELCLNDEQKKQLKEDLRIVQTVELL